MPSTGSLDLAACRRFLFLQYETALGTAVLATPTFQALRRAHPDAHVTVAAAGFPAQVLRDHPAVDDVIETPHALREFPRALAFVLRRIWPRRHEFDCVVVDGGNRRSKIALLALATGIRRRVGFAAARDFYHASVDYDESLGVLQNNLRILTPFGIEPAIEEPRVYCAAADLAAVEALLAAQGVTDERPLLAMITQTSGGHPNEWFADRFAAVAEAAQRRHGAQIVLVGARGEAEGIERLRALTTARTLSLAGQTDIPKLAALFARCDGVVTVDTGGMHVARGVGVPTVVAGHSANERYEWLPVLNERLTVIRHEEVPCAHCRKNFCATRECMQEITVEEVVAALDAAWDRFPPSAASRAERMEAVVGRPRETVA